MAVWGGERDHGSNSPDEGDRQWAAPRRGPPPVSGLAGSPVRRCGVPPAPGQCSGPMAGRAPADAAGREADVIEADVPELGGKYADLIRRDPAVNPVTAGN